jgi:hypothetical protein
VAIWSIFLVFILAQAKVADGQTVEVHSIINHCVQASGGYEQVSGINDFVGKGTITYNWPGEQNHGPATIQGRGPHQVLFSSAMPSGPMRWTVHGKYGKAQNGDKASHSIPPNIAFELGSLLAPMVRFLHIDKEGWTVAYRGAEQVGNRLVDNIAFSGSGTTQDVVVYSVDREAGEIVKVATASHASNDRKGVYLNELLFSDYRRVDGVMLPFEIVHKLNGQTQWTLQLDTIRINVGLAASDVTF